MSDTKNANEDKQQPTIPVDVVRLDEVLGVLELAKQRVMEVRATINVGEPEEESSIGQTR